MELQDLTMKPKPQAPPMSDGLLQQLGDSVGINNSPAHQVLELNDAEDHNA
ncbi:unnamed protein product [Ilex paraguariensis]|uniref:Uncharacterized protein n=1 Tax=Ilex paraguariensis TaxID=185542 RepID=A0ABC8TE18_9AQUA